MDPGSWVMLAAFNTVARDRETSDTIADVNAAGSVLVIAGLSAGGFLPPQAAAIAVPAAELERELGGRVLDASEDVARWVRRHVF